MKKLEYISEATFKPEDVLFDEEHYKLTKDIHKRYESVLLSKCSPIIVRDDKKSLCFCINLGDKDKDRFAYENGDNKYRITIEKIN